MSVVLKPCPGTCGRLTYPRVRRTDYYLSHEDRALVQRMGAVKAVTKDGTCTKCWNASHGYGRNGRARTRYKKFTPGRYRHEMTDAEIEQSRERMKNYWRDRRARGVDPDGNDPANLGNGGLYCIEVV